MRAAAGDGGKERKSGGALVIIDEMVQVKVEYIGWLWSFHLWRVGTGTGCGMRGWYGPEGK